LISGTLGGSGQVTNQGRILVQSAIINNSITNQALLLARSSAYLYGALSTTSSSTIRVEGDPNCCSSYLSIANGFTNNGAIQLTAVNGSGHPASPSVTSGTLINAVGATIVSDIGTGSTRSLDAVLDNRGTLTINQ